MDLETNTLTLLGIRFHRLTQWQLLQCIINAGQQDKKSIIANVNVHAMNLAYELDGYRDFLNQADVVFCDGFGVALATRLTGQSISAKHRHTCPDWIEDLAVACQEHNLSLFLLAGNPGIAETAAEKLKHLAPHLKIATHQGYFKKTGAENDEVVSRINAFKPDILYVGFGMPLQEQWIQENIHQLEAKVFLPLGACLDFYAGQVYRGPGWLTDHGLEWLSRLFTEPRRLWHRYLVGNPLFIARVVKHHWLKKQ